MKKGLLIVGGIIALLVIIVLMKIPGKHDEIVQNQESYKEAWGNVQVAYQNRADAISEMAEIVQQMSEEERKTYTEVVEARSKATSLNINIDNIDPAKVKQFMEYQSQISQGLGRLIASFEKYPDLKQGDLYQDMLTETRGLENRISVARKRYNEEIKPYNNLVRGFWMKTLWSNFISLDMDEMPYFEAEQTAQSAPKNIFN